MKHDLFSRKRTSTMRIILEAGLGLLFAVSEHLAWASNLQVLGTPPHDLARVQYSPNLRKVKM